VQVLSRLFPFARGLCHAYWAPNAWALYSFTDKIAAAATAAAGLRQPSATPAANMAGGVVGVSSYVLLPNIGAGSCAALTLLAILPCLMALWKAPKAQAGPMFAAAAAYANLCGFMFGYHVHEKAAITVLLPMVLTAVRDAAWGQHFVVLSSSAHVGIFPLLFGVQEVPVRWLLAALYYIGCIWGLSSIHGRPSQQQQQQSGLGVRAATILGQEETPSKQQQQARDPDSLQTPAGVRTRRQAAAATATPSPSKQVASRKQSAAAGAVAAQQQARGAFPVMKECCSCLPVIYRLYLVGLVVVEMYCTLGHRFLLGDRLPFVPLMLTSVYCALGVTWVWGWMALWFVQRCSSSGVTVQQ
jgi:alpha-1,3-glucosyltransferase